MDLTFVLFISWTAVGAVLFFVSMKHTVDYRSMSSRELPHISHSLLKWWTGFGVAIMAIVASQRLESVGPLFVLIYSVWIIWHGIVSFKNLKSGVIG